MEVLQTKADKESYGVLLSCKRFKVTPSKKNGEREREDKEETFELVGRVKLSKSCRKRGRGGASNRMSGREESYQDCCVRANRQQQSLVRKEDGNEQVEIIYLTSLFFFYLGIMNKKISRIKIHDSNSN